jgi:hypothetical protein
VVYDSEVQLRYNQAFKTAIGIAFECAPIFQGVAHILRARFLNHDWFIIYDAVFYSQENGDKVLEELRSLVHEQFGVEGLY